MIDRPLVSVLVPCFNQGRFLRRALDSVRSQTHSHWECIVVDDGSTDETAAVAQGYVARDPRIRLVTQGNRGLAAARNRGLAEACGDYVQFLDADDTLLPTKIARQLDALRGVDGPAVAYCDYYVTEIDRPDRLVPDGPLTKPRLDSVGPLLDLIRRWETDLSIPIHSALFDNAFVSSGRALFDESLPSHEDLDWWIQILAQEPPLVRVEERLVVYTKHSRSMCQDYARMRRGLRAALDKQRALWRAEPRVAGALRAKRRNMRAVYRRMSAQARPQGLGFRLHKLVRAWAPTRVRQALLHLGILDAVF